jgi:nitrite reductase/ring-hydroxylating ferredoxin subunit/DMSO/TMAO reductase YedYZ heme-binding membrane subunit
MGHAYRAVGWNAQKRAYDLVLAGGIAAYLALFVAAGLAAFPNASPETLLIRALGTGAFALLHVILCIGPLCRLDRRWLPLLYNRRHMGVAMFFLALGHGGFATVYFHAFGDTHPLVSMLSANARITSLAQFPFQPLGALALTILFLMAATSHDFWLANLTAPVWKALHMLVYVAYGLVVLHVALGTLQAERSPWMAAGVGAGLLLVCGLHLAAGARERAADAPHTGAVAGDGFVDVCAVDEIPADRARIVALAGDRVAVFHYGARVSALSNACQHQNGPLGEGRVIDGCVICPWHGYQYRPEDGRSPAPFTEKVPTFRVRVARGRVLVHPVPLPAGTPTPPASCTGGHR